MQSMFCMYCALAAKWCWIDTQSGVAASMGHVACPLYCIKAVRVLHNHELEVEACITDGFHLPLRSGHGDLHAY